MAKTTRVLVVGSGAREHALARALAGNGRELLIAPGNAGTAALGRNVAVPPNDVAGLVDLARRESIDLVVVGPELPLTLGLVDALVEAGVPAFGPTRAAARLEGSKAFMKRLLTRAGVPTAAFEVFDDPAAAEDYVRRAKRPLVVKADGLAAGKGVVIAPDDAVALAAIDDMMRKRVFGEAGRIVVIEEVLPGQEASFHVVSDGQRAISLAPAQDHKRVRDGDAGPNTGGMGAYAPAPVVTDAVQERVMRTAIEPVLEQLAREGTPFCGVLFAGLMIEDGVARVLEFNVRFGDPETAVLVPTYGGDWLELLMGASSHRLPAGGAKPSGAALCVVMAAQGYPAAPRTGDVIHGLEAPVAPGAFVLHAGTKRVGDAVVTGGGRVLTVGAHAATLDEAARLAYATVSPLGWDGEHHRSDIGHRALAAPGRSL
jgi:phosphoribosylamine---glycine ligase